MVIAFMVEKITVVSLGDSIATGTLTPFSNIHSYVYHLQKKLHKQGCRADMYNFACDGDTSRELLWKLRNARNMREAVRKADVITISIGGNDLLKALSVPGFTRLNTRAAESGVKAVLHNWPQIIDEIKNINPTASIVVLTLYNPYNETPFLGRRYAHDKNLCELTDSFITQINGFFIAHAEGSYRIADAYGQFKRYSKGNMYRVACLYPYSVFRNPHPTPEGQQILADLIAEQLAL